MFLAESGYRFIELVDSGMDLESAARDSWVSFPLQHKSLKPNAEIERKLAKANSISEIAVCFARTKYATLFSKLGWPLAYRVADAVVNLAETKSRGSYLYYFLVGLGVISTNKHIRMCECCGWRMKKIGNSRYCPLCSTNIDERNNVKTTRLRRQRKILASLVNSNEYVNYTLLRDLAEYYPLRRMLGWAEKSVKGFVFDKLDGTPDQNYRVAKEELAQVWLVTEHDARSKKSNETDSALLKLAKNGLTRAAAARVLGISKAAVTKACIRNSILKATFHSWLGGESIVVSK
jgi:hypothetical protein